MLDSLEAFGPATSPRNRLAVDVDILSVATATPEHVVSQTDAYRRVKRLFPVLSRLSGVYTSSGIETRYSCVSPDWCEGEHGWQSRTDVYQRHAVDLLEKVAAKAIAAAGLEPRDVDAIVTNTITGVTVPSLDVLVMNRLDFRETITRLPIFGFGCGGGIGGLSRAAQLAKSMPGANVLFLTVELSSLCARPNDSGLANFVATALFGDGAAGVVLCSPGHESQSGQSARRMPRIRAVGEHCWRKTASYLGFDVKDEGFSIVLSPSLPALIRDNLAPAVNGFLGSHAMSLSEFDGFLMHAGGRKILETAEVVLGASRAQTEHSWSIMRDYGNMSSATVLFVLERAMAAGATGRHLLAAFGPGFAAYFAVVDL